RSKTTSEATLATVETYASSCSIVSATVNLTKSLTKPVVVPTVTIAHCATYATMQATSRISAAFSTAGMNSKNVEIKSANGPAIICRFNKLKNIINTITINM